MQHQRLVPLLGVVQDLVQMPAVHGLAARGAAIVVIGSLWAGLGTPWKVRLVDVLEFARHAAIIRPFRAGWVDFFFQGNPLSAMASPPGLDLQANALAAPRISA